MYSNVALTAVTTIATIASEASEASKTCSKERLFGHDESSMYNHLKIVHFYRLWSILIRISKQNKTKSNTSVSVDVSMRGFEFSWPTHMCNVTGPTHRDMENPKVIGGKC